MLRASDAGLAREARRLHAGRAVQRVDADARIVGERGQTGQAARVPRLGKRVFDKRMVRLGGFRDAELGLSDHFDSQRRQQTPEFPQLARVAGREHEARDHGPGVSDAAVISCAP